RIAHRGKARPTCNFPGSRQRLDLGRRSSEDVRSMPRHARGPYLWLRPPRERGDPAIWIIRDRGHQLSIGLGAGDHREAETALAEYIASKYAPARRERDIAEIP